MMHSTLGSANSNVADDLVLPFQLESSHLRGRLVRLGEPLNAILHRHDYPEKVGVLLGEAIVLAAALGTMLKFDGVFTLQTKSDGAVRMLVVDVTSKGTVRGYAQFDAARVAPENDNLLGKGYLAFTVDQSMKDERYQGIVSLEDGHLATAVQHAFRQSEQIPTGLIASVRRNDSGNWRGGCLMLQQIAREGGSSVKADTSVEDDWHHAMMLMQTCTMEELTDPSLAAEQLLFRLFHEEGVRVYDRLSLQHECRCSRERVTKMLTGLPPEELDDLADNGIVSVNCEFCNRNYNFDAAQRAALQASTD